jgi:hypothetical protein
MKSLCAFPSGEASNIRFSDDGIIKTKEFGPRLTRSYAFSRGSSLY